MFVFKFSLDIAVLCLYLIFNRAANLLQMVYQKKYFGGRMQIKRENFCENQAKILRFKGI